MLAQSFKYWKLLVVGDACTADTAKVVQAFGDSRIFYVNLQERCGEQSGPISAGSACATGDHIAYLNHDDLWLPDHLEIALSRLQTSGAELFVGQAAFTTYADYGDQMQPVVNAVSPTDRTLAMAFFHKPTLFEPTSSWVLKRTLYEKVGPWKPAKTLIRSPFEDWLLRAWKEGAALENGDRPTTIYCNAEKRKWVNCKDKKKPYLYSMPPEEQEFWWKKIDRITSQDLRALVCAQAKSFTRKPDYFGHRSAGTPAQDVYKTLLTPNTAELFRWTGWDALNPAAQLTSRHHGGSLSMMLRRRTGEGLPDVENWEQAIEYGAQQLSWNSNWFEYEC